MYSAFTKNDIGVCLSGGVARGAAHIGVLQALLEKGFNVKAVSGASAGALVGLFFAAGYKPHEMLSILKSINWFTIFTLGKGGMLGFKKAFKIVRSYIQYDDIKDLPVYYSASVLDLFSGKTLYLDEGDPASIAIGSCALPFIFEPVAYKNMLLVDGGLTENLPVNPIKIKYPNLKVVCSDIMPNVLIKENLGAFGNFLRSTFLIARRNMDLSKKLCDIYLDLPVQHISFINYKKFDELYDIGYSYTKSIIEKNL
ncbi:MAG: patatin-like phospholipase family protein [Hydrogenobaculum sp.]